MNKVKVDYKPKQEPVEAPETLREALLAGLLFVSVLAGAYLLLVALQVLL